MLKADNKLLVHLNAAVKSTSPKNKEICSIHSSLDPYTGIKDISVTKKIDDRYSKAKKNYEDDWSPEPLKRHGSAGKNNKIKSMLNSQGEDELKRSRNGAV